MSFFIEEMKYLQHTRKKSVADCCFVGLLLLLLNPSIQHIITLSSFTAENRFHVSFKVALAKKKNDTGGRDFKGEEGKRIL